jgi:hypothetical protein
MKFKFLSLVLAIVALSGTSAFAYTSKQTHHYRSNSMNMMRGHSMRGQESPSNSAGGSRSMSGTTSSKSGGGSGGGGAGGAGGGGQ